MHAQWSTYYVGEFPIILYFLSTLHITRLPFKLVCSIVATLTFLVPMEGLSLNDAWGYRRNKIYDPGIKSLRPMIYWPQLGP